MIHSGETNSLREQYSIAAVWSQGYAGMCVLVISLTAKLCLQNTCKTVFKIAKEEEYD